MIRHLERHGASKLHVHLCEQPYPVERHFAEHPPETAALRFHLEAEASGTAGVVKRLGANQRETLLVTMGDRVTDVDLGAALAFHKAQGALVTAILVPGDRAEVASRAQTDAACRMVAFDASSTDRRGPSAPAST